MDWGFLAQIYGMQSPINSESEFHPGVAAQGSLATSNTN